MAEASDTQQPSRKAVEPASAGSQLPAMSAMIAWCKAWILDFDICRCRKCGRGINVERMNEALVHDSECSQAHLIAPWQDLRSRIPANVKTVGTEGSGESPTGAAQPSSQD
jgi:hypothetical protein